MTRYQIIGGPYDGRKVKLQMAVRVYVVPMYYAGLIQDFRYEAIETDEGPALVPEGSQEWRRKAKA